MSVRVSPYLLSLIDWANPYNDPLRTPVHPGGVAPACPIIPSSGSTRCTSSADAPVAGAHAPLPRQGAVPRARHLPGLLPLLHAQLRGRRRHRRGREGPPQGRTRSAGSARSSTSRRAPSSRTSSSPAATPTSCAPSRSRRSATRCSRSRNIRRMRFATKGPAVMPHEDPHRRRVARRAHRASSSTGASCTRKSCSTRTSTTRTRSPASPKRAMDRLFERGIIVRNQSVLQRGVNDDRDDEAARQAARAPQRAPVLRLHARPREGRRGSAHDACRRRSTSRSTCAARPRASTRRRSSSTRRAAAASATRTRTSTTTATPGIACSRRRGEAGRSSCTSIRSTRCPSTISGAGAIPKKRRRWSTRPSTKRSRSSARGSFARNCSSSTQHHRSMPMLPNPTARAAVGRGAERR